VNEYNKLYRIILLSVGTSIIFFILEKKYHLTLKYSNNKKFRKLINFSSAISVLLSLFIRLIINADYAWMGCSLPFLLWIGLRMMIKQKKVSLTYCYYCGSELNGSNKCPSCDKELDI